MSELGPTLEVEQADPGCGQADPNAVLNWLKRDTWWFPLLPVFGEFRIQVLYSLVMFSIFVYFVIDIIQCMAGLGDCGQSLLDSMEVPGDKLKYVWMCVVAFFIAIAIFKLWAARYMLQSDDLAKLFHHREGTDAMTFMESLATATLEDVASLQVLVGLLSLPCFFAFWAYDPLHIFDLLFDTPSKMDPRVTVFWRYLMPWAVTLYPSMVCDRSVLLVAEILLSTVQRFTVKYSRDQNNVDTLNHDFFCRFTRKYNKLDHKFQAISLPVFWNVLSTVSSLFAFAVTCLATWACKMHDLVVAVPCMIGVAANAYMAIYLLWPLAGVGSACSDRLCKYSRDKPGSLTMMFATKAVKNLTQPLSRLVRRCVCGSSSAQSTRQTATLSSNTDEKQTSLFQEVLLWGEVPMRSELATEYIRMLNVVSMVRIGIRFPGIGLITKKELVFYARALITVIPALLTLSVATFEAHSTSTTATPTSISQNRISF